MSVDRRAFTLFVAFGLALSPAARASLAYSGIKALVIGNGYRRENVSWLRLVNAETDAHLVGDAFETLPGAQVLRLIDTDFPSFQAGVEQFALGLTKQSVALLYYSGHAVQIDGANYILSADGESLIELGALLSRIRDSGSAAVVFIDACRNNPFAKGDASLQAGQPTALRMYRSLSSRSAVEHDGNAALSAATFERLRSAVQAGLARLDVTGANLMVMFATDPNNVAVDFVEFGDPNGPFASVLAQAIKDRADIDSIAAKVTAEVSRKTNGRQTPWRQSSLTQPLFLNGPPPRFSTGRRFQAIP